MNQDGTPQTIEPERFYFKTSMISYNVGLFFRIMAMAVTHLPQPALLYILPAMTILYLTAAFIRRETVEMMWYDEDLLIQKFEVTLSKPKRPQEP